MRSASAVVLSPPGDGELQLGQISDHPEELVYARDRLEQFIKEPRRLSNVVKTSQMEQLIRGPFLANGDRQKRQFIKLERVTKDPNPNALAFIEFPGCLVGGHGADSKSRGTHNLCSQPQEFFVTANLDYDIRPLCRGARRISGEGKW
jgi:hypothetical protein